MIYEIVLKEVTIDECSEFDSDQNRFSQVKKERVAEVAKFRLEGYFPKFKKDLCDFVMSKMD